MTYHMYKFHADSFSQQAARVIQSRDQLIQTRPLYFLTFDVSQRVVKVEHDTALLQLPDHEAGLITSCCVCHTATNQTYTQQPHNLCGRYDEFCHTFKLHQVADSHLYFPKLSAATPP